MSAKELRQALETANKQPFFHQQTYLGLIASILIEVLEGFERADQEAKGYALQSDDWVNRETSR